MMVPPSVADQYPYLAEVVIELGTSGYDYTEEFAFAPELILDAIERLRQQDKRVRYRRVRRWPA